MATQSNQNSNNQNFSAGDVSPWRALIPTVLNMATGAAMGVNPFAVGLSGLKTGMNAFDTVNKYKDNYNTFTNQRKAIIDNIPEELKGQISPLINNASSYDDLDRVNKTYLPMIGNLNQSQHNSNYANTGDNSYSGGYYDPDKQNTQINNYASQIREGRKTGTTDQFMDARTQGLPKPQVNNQQPLQNVNNIVPAVNNQPLPDMNNPIMQNPNLSLEQKREALGYGQNPVLNASAVQTNYTPPNLYEVINNPNLFSDARKEGYKYNPSINPEAGLQVAKTTGQNITNKYLPQNLQAQINQRNAGANLSNVNAAQAPIRTGIMQQNANTSRMNAGTNANKGSANAQKGLQSLQRYSANLNELENLAGGFQHPTNLGGQAMMNAKLLLQPNHTTPAIAKFEAQKKHVAMTGMKAIEDVTGRPSVFTMEQLMKTLPNYDDTPAVIKAKMSAFKDQVNTAADVNYGTTMQPQAPKQERATSKSGKPMIKINGVWHYE